MPPGLPAVCILPLRALRIFVKEVLSCFDQTLLHGIEDVFALGRRPLLQSACASSPVVYCVASRSKPLITHKSSGLHTAPLLSLLPPAPLKKITPTSTPNSRLYSRTYLVFVLAKCHRSAMPLWFHLVFESQRRRHARLVSIGAGRRRRRRDSPAPAPGLDHDYGQITTSVLP